MELNSTNNDGKTYDFESVVAESKQKIVEEMVQKQPKKRGRPSKNQNQAQSNPSPQNSSGPSIHGSTSPGLGPQQSNFPDISNQIKVPIQVLSRLPAIKYQIQELAFDDNEALMVAQSVNEVLKAFIPDVEKMSPKTAAILSMSLVLGSLSFNKYMIFNSVMQERAIKNQVNQTTAEVKEQVLSQDSGPVLSKDSVNANQLFRKS